jgi:REP-associated tyrosine transposase
MSDIHVSALIKMIEQATEKKPWGGARRGAGRKKTKYRSGTPHRRRQRFEGWRPVHVVLRAMPYVPRLRDAVGYRAVGAALAECAPREDFHVVHISIQSNHIHLLVEADGDRALSRGMQALVIHLARSINAAFGNAGRCSSSATTRR